MSTSDRMVAVEGLVGVALVVVGVSIASPDDIWMSGFGLHPAWIPIILLAARYMFNVPMQGNVVVLFGIVLLFGHPVRTALTVSASLAQIGEFSFILAAVSVQLGGMRQETHDLILAAALLSISLNPFVFALIDRMGARPKPPLKGSPEGLILAEEKAAAVNPATA